MKNPALFIVDLQEGMREHIVNAPSVITGAVSVVQKARTKGIPIFCFKYIETEKDRKTFGGTVWTPPNSPASEPMNELCITEKDYVFEKSEYSAFTVPAVEILLKQLEVDAIWLCGAMAQVCVLATSIDAYERNYEVLAIEDAIGAYNESNLEMGLTWMSKYTATLTLSKDL